ncbi:TPM domain-containing protein [Flavobacteriaceae bacterium AH-315-O20]|nr:TPM domain-containing protein [Flavobacteriaceae bacterium AH-315-O20]
MTEAEEFLTTEDEQKIVKAIQEAETATSGEIRVHLENDLKEDCLEHAKEVFNLLHMDETKDKNGVLFYVAVKAKQFAIVGDSGIDKVVPDNFWESVKNTVTSEFTKGNKANGLILGILEAGKKLQQFFPYEKEDKNELSDEISKG